MFSVFVIIIFYVHVLISQTRFLLTFLYFVLVKKLGVSVCFWVCRVGRSWEYRFKTVVSMQQIGVNAEVGTKCGLLHSLF